MKMFASASAMIAQVVLARGVIVTNARCDYPADPGFFGPQSFREFDCNFCYNNLKDNVSKRIAACRNRMKQEESQAKT